MIYLEPIDRMTRHPSNEKARFLFYSGICEKTT